MSYSLSRKRATVKRLNQAVIVPNGRKRGTDAGGCDGEYVENMSPFRKQSLDDRRRYMREYMRGYRLAHPGLSTPYVRKFRAKHDLR